MKTAIAVRHVAFEDLGSLEEVLRAREISVRYVEAGIDDLASIAPEAADLAIVLGGPIGVYEIEQYPFLVQEIEWLRARLSRDLPTVGICLGAQMMAAALGAQVYSGKAGKEIGWAPLEPGPHAREFPFIAPLLDGRTSVLHWHGDTFDLPAGARHIAGTQRYPNQAFAWGRNGLALQFHLEVQARRLESWFIGHACEISGVRELSPQQLRRDTAQHAAALESMAPAIWNSWLDSLDNPR